MSFVLKVDNEISLRLLEPHHAEELYAVVDANREHLGRWEPWPSVTNSAEDIRAYATRSLQAFADHKAVSLSILLEGKVVGNTGWTDWKDEADAMGVRFASADIGYWIAADYEGRGIVTRCVAALIRHAFEEYSMKRLTIRAQPENEKSWAVAERLGFKREGTMRSVCQFNGKWIDLHLYALLAEDEADDDGEVRR